MSDIHKLSEVSTDARHYGVVELLEETLADIKSGIIPGIPDKAMFVMLSKPNEEGGRINRLRRIAGMSASEFIYQCLYEAHIPINNLSKLVDITGFDNSSASPTPPPSNVTQLKDRNNSPMCVTVKQLLEEAIEAIEDQNAEIVPNKCLIIMLNDEGTGYATKVFNAGLTEIEKIALLSIVHSDAINELSLPVLGLHS